MLKTTQEINRKTAGALRLGALLGPVTFVAPTTTRCYEPLIMVPPILNTVKAFD